MKRFLMAMVCLMTMVVFSSCSTKYLATANYDVCYPDGTRTYDGAAIVTSSSEPSVICYSFQGTNYVSVLKTDVSVSATNVGGIVVMNASNIKKTENIASSTAPMRLNSYRVEKYKKKKKRTTYGGDMYMSDILSSRKY